jgi:hypothetical protein
LVVETLKGVPRGFLLLSVKQQFRRSYQLAVISDPIHVPAKDLVGANLAANMLGAAKIWLAQANVMLQRVGAINDVVVPIDLGDPIVLDDPVIYSAIIQASFTKQLVQADLFIYGTWNIVYRTSTLPAGSTVFNTCFVENAWSGRAGELLSAHEVGHGLGLPHSNGRADFLMSPDSLNNDFLDMWDIEGANRL